MPWTHGLRRELCFDVFIKYLLCGGHSKRGRFPCPPHPKCMCRYDETAVSKCVRGYRSFPARAPAPQSPRGVLRAHPTRLYPPHTWCLSWAGHSDIAFRAAPRPAVNANCQRGGGSEPEETRQGRAALRRGARPPPSSAGADTHLLGRLDGARNSGRAPVGVPAAHSRVHWQLRLKTRASSARWWRCGP